MRRAVSAGTFGQLAEMIRAFSRDNVRSRFALSFCLLAMAAMAFFLPKFETAAADESRTSRRSVISLMYFNHSNSLMDFSAANRSGSCRWLRGFKHQGKFCRKRKGLPEVLASAKQLALEHCRNQFRYDRWNCSYKRSFFKKLYRETAFMQSLATAAIMYSIARACSDGKLLSCKCPVYQDVPAPGSNWTWGGCGDNIKGARRITSKFLQLRQKGDDFKQVQNYNGEVGIASIASNEMIVCTCHGISASCVMKTCWKRIKPFAHVADDLKNHYHSAIRLSSTENRANVRPLLNRKANPKTLHYMALSPNFCPSTAGRRCRDVGNCETLCCGRGFRRETVLVNRKCRCRWQNTSYPSVKCNVCEEEDTELTCK